MELIATRTWRGSTARATSIETARSSKRSARRSRRSSRAEWWRRSARPQRAARGCEQRLEGRRHLDRAADDAGAVALQPVAVGRMAAAGDDDDEVVGARGDGPWVQGEALARHLLRGDLDPRRAAGPAEVVARNPRVLPEELADRTRGPAEPGHGLRHHAREHQDARGAVLVAREPGHVGHAHEVGHAVHALERV